MFSGRLWNLFIDSFPKMFMQGLTVTIPLTVIWECGQFLDLMSKDVRRKK